MVSTLVKAGIAYLLAQGERQVRRDMQSSPKGTFFAEDWVNDDGLTEAPIPIEVRVTITDDEFVADFTGSARRPRDRSTAVGTGLMGGMRTIFKALTNPDTPVNEGCFRPRRDLS